MTNVVELKKFRKKLRSSLQSHSDFAYVLVCVPTGDNTDGGFIEHTPTLDGYQVLGILDWGKSLQLASVMTESK